MREGLSRYIPYLDLVPTKGKSSGCFCLPPLPTYLHLVTTFQSVWPDGQIVFQYLAILDNENLPKGIKVVSKWLQNFSK